MRRATSIAAIAILIVASLYSEAVVAQSRADQALELLRLAVSCPAKPIVQEQLEPVNTEGTYRTFQTLSFAGSSTLLRLVVKTERHLHDRKANSVTTDTDQLSYSAPFSAIAAIDVVGSDAANNPTLALACKADGCFLEKRDDGYSVNDDSVHVELCDAGMASKAKIAIDILRAADQEASEPIPFKLYQKTASLGRNLGEAIDGSSAGDCLRKCRADGRCKAFTVVRGDTDVCRLKSSTGQMAQDDFSNTGVLERDALVTPPAEGSNENRGGSRWMHNGSVVTLASEGAKREFYYFVPHKGLDHVGVRPGTLLFSGKRSGSTYSGTAFIFNKHCGPLAYQVAGEVSSDDHQVTMEGQAPIVDGSCKTTTTKPDTLIFSYRGN